LYSRYLANSDADAALTALALYEAVSKDKEVLDS